MGKKLIIKNANFYNNCIKDGSGGSGSEAEIDAQRFQRYINALEYLVNLNVTQGNRTSRTYLGIPTLAENSRRAFALLKANVESDDEIYNSVAASEQKGDSSKISPLNDTYTFLPVPPKIKTVTFGFTDSNYSVGGMLLSTTNNKVSDSGWVRGGTSHTIDVSTYNQTMWIGFNSKKEIGNLTFTNQETIQSLGFHIEFTY